MVYIRRGVFNLAIGGVVTYCKCIPQQEVKTQETADQNNTTGEVKFSPSSSLQHHLILDFGKWLTDLYSWHTHIHLYTRIHTHLLTYTHTSVTRGSSCCRKFVALRLRCGSSSPMTKSKRHLQIFHPLIVVKFVHNIGPKHRPLCSVHLPCFFPTNES